MPHYEHRKDHSSESAQASAAEDQKEKRPVSWPADAAGERGLAEIRTEIARKVAELRELQQREHELVQGSVQGGGAGGQWPATFDSPAKKKC